MASAGHPAPPTPAHVAQTALIAGALPLDQLVLLGVFTKPSGTTALLRRPDGAIVTVTAGDMTAGVTIAAIGDDTVHLVDAADTPHVLSLPTG